MVFLTCCRHSTHCGAVHRQCRAWVDDELPAECGCVNVVRASSWYELLILFLCSYNHSSCPGWMNHCFAYTCGLVRTAILLKHPLTQARPCMMILIMLHTRWQDTTSHDHRRAIYKAALTYIHTQQFIHTGTMSALYNIRHPQTHM